MTEPVESAAETGATPASAGVGTSGGRGTANGEPVVLVRDTPAEVSAAAAELIVSRLDAAITASGRADFLTTGGSTPVGIYNVLSSALRDRADWTRVHFWWGDDRYVPRDHPLSNVQPADAILFASSQFSGQSGNLTEGVDVELGLEPGLVVPVENIHPFPCGTAIAHVRGAAWAAQEYANELRAAHLPIVRGFPVFDVVLLGLGPDGHLMSVFPGSAALDSEAWALEIPAPAHVEPHIERVTLNPAVLGVARSVVMVTSGAAKAGVIEQIFTTVRDARRLPAQLVRRSGATWILDREAADRLPAGIAQR